MHVKCMVHIFSGSFGSFGSAVVERGIIDMRVRANEPNEPARLVHC